MPIQPFVVLDQGRATTVTATVSPAGVRLSSEALHATLGWELLPEEGLCRDGMCIPVALNTALVTPEGVDLASLATVLDRPLALDLETGAAYLGASAQERRLALTSLQAPDFTLPDLNGTLHSLSDYRGHKVFLVAYASWWGCRLDLPVWQAMYQELHGYGLTVITVALDKDVEAARPWIEAAQPTHPSLIDTQHLVADLYGMVNVPTVVWIDENGRIVRPNDVAFGTDTFKAITGIEAAPHLAALRAWVRDGAAGLSAQESRQLQALPTPQMQQARAHFGLAKWLAAHGFTEAAERHFMRAGELAPHDFTIRRGSMPMRGLDPMGPEFREMLQAWTQAGHRYYQPLPH